VLVRLCPACGSHLPYPGRGKCRDCQREYERKRGTRRLAIKQQPYCSVPGCTSTDLTGDHRVPLSRGGTSTLENVQVLCRRHNSAKRDRDDRDPAFLRADQPEPSPALRETKSLGGRNLPEQSPGPVNIG
jgi:5-methylcytosine-specific restriction endonuclease McrA